MCDTIGLLTPTKTWFAKNSDRSPNEPQVCELFPAADHPLGGSLKATHITIPQVEHTHALLLSRPTWLWGGEMGVNEFGVCIGNEAVFTRGKYAKTGLTGMDLLRLGLERGSSARQARDVIISLLETHGQGGNSGYDHNFFYDNSFLIIDREELFVLETAGRGWVYKQLERATISNRLTIGTEGDAYSGGEVINFKKTHLEPLFSHFSGSAHRQEETGTCLASVQSIRDLQTALRTHRADVVHPLTRGSVSSPCMHAGGLVGDHTTASMIIEMDKDIKVWLTGSSTPCISLFKPWQFGSPPSGVVFEAGDPAGEAYWYKREAFHRQALGHVLPADFYSECDDLEAKWLAEVENADRGSWNGLSDRALREEESFFARWSSDLTGLRVGTPAFHRYWQKKNAALGKEPDTV